MEKLWLNNIEFKKVFVLGMIINYSTFTTSDKADLGSAGEQPNRNNLTDWNGQGE